MIIQVLEVAPDDVLLFVPKGESLSEANLDSLKNLVNKFASGLNCKRSVVSGVDLLVIKNADLGGDDDSGDA